MIRMNDFQAEPKELFQRQMQAVERVLRGGRFILGSEVAKFESAWANACGARYAVGVGSGLDALEIGMRALGIGAGDEVVTTSLTAFATVLAVMRAGATPVLADIDPQTGLMDPDSVERCLSSRTKAVLLVHLYGRMREMDRWQDLCRSARVLILEDCAQAHLASWNGRAAGRHGEWGAYSFYPTKNLGALGDAGALVTDDESVAQRARILRNYGQAERYHHVEPGLNSRLDEIQAALLSVRLGYLQDFTERRRGIARLYHASIRNPAVTLLQSSPDDSNHVHHLFDLLCNERNRLIRHLEEHDILALSHYPVPIHRQPPCREARRDPQGLRRAEHFADRCLSIPCHPHMSESDVQRVAEAINAFR